VFDTLTNYVSGSPTTYGIVAGVAALDAFFPLVPSETIVITAGVLAGKGHLFVWAVFPAAAIGSFVGDNVSYFVGSKIGDPVARKLFRGEKGQKRLKQAETMLQRNGSILIVAARFIPGGRTATTFAAGTLEFSYRRFVVADAVAGVLWGAYGTGIGYFGGSTFADSTWKPLLLAFGIAVGVAVLLEIYRRVQRARGRDVLGGKT
jgi:membrane protein DedA with SNARE-associated domain